MAQEENKYLGEIGFPQLIEEIKTRFSKIGHKHLKSEITDLEIDETLSSDSENPVQNKVVTSEITVVQTNLNSHTENKSNPHEVTLAQLGLTATATELNYMDGVTSAIQTQLNKKANDYSLELYNGTSGNPKPVKFVTVDYSTCNSENGVAIKIGMVSGHGNGSSYAFLQDVILKVNYQGTVSVDNFKYYGADAGTYDGAARQYGDIFWVHDTTNKLVKFFCLMGQYARVNVIPYKRLTYSSGGTITQHTTCATYSSGTIEWGNNSRIALMSDLSEIQAQVDELTASVVTVHSGAEDPIAELGEDGDIYLVTE